VPFAHQRDLPEPLCGIRQQRIEWMIKDLEKGLKREE